MLGMEDNNKQLNDGKRKNIMEYITKIEKDLLKEKEDEKFSRQYVFCVLSDLKEFAEISEDFHTEIVQKQSRGIRELEEKLEKFASHINDQDRKIKDLESLIEITKEIHDKEQLELNQCAKEIDYEEIYKHELHLHEKLKRKFELLKVVIDSETEK